MRHDSIYTAPIRISSRQTQEGEIQFPGRVNLLVSGVVLLREAERRLGLSDTLAGQHAGLVPPGAGGPDGPGDGCASTCSRSRSAKAVVGRANPDPGENANDCDGLRTDHLFMHNRGPGAGEGPGPPAVLSADHERAGERSLAYLRKWIHYKQDKEQVFF